MILDRDFSAGVSLAGAPKGAPAGRRTQTVPPSEQQAQRMIPHLAAIVQQSEDAIISSTLEGTILSWNRGAFKVYGYTAEEALGKSAAILFPPDRVPELEGMLAQLRTGNAVAQPHTERLRKDGTRIQVSVSLSPIKDDGGLPIGVSAICRDISGHVRTLREIEAMNAELHRLSGQLLRLQDEERRRIARELHDGPVQELAALQLSLDAMSDLAEVRASADAVRMLHRSAKLATDCARGLRTLSYLLHPPMLDELGLATALQMFVEGFAQRTGIAVELRLPDGLGRLAPDLELALFRIAQESLANAYRHSESDEVEIRGFIEGEAFVMEIEDHGRGMKLPGHPTTDGVRLGVGIPGMQERAHQLGGEFEIQSERGRTVVRVRFPIWR
jgi:PAS domain S-box-containing protein